MYSSPQNLILRSAAKARLPHLARKLKHVTFEAGQTLSGAPGSGAILVFPLRGVLSLQLSSGPRQVEIGLVGREGFTGVPLFLGAAADVTSPLSLTEGEAVMMPLPVFHSYLRNSGFRGAVEGYAQLFTRIIAHGSVCNRVHVIADVCINRLLQMQDRTQTDAFHVTQETMAQHLGVRRASVNRAVGELLKSGSIQYDRRGRIKIADRRKLESSACTCYQAMKAGFDALVSANGGL